MYSKHDEKPEMCKTELALPKLTKVITSSLQLFLPGINRFYPHTMGILQKKNPEFNNKFTFQLNSLITSQDQNFRDRKKDSL